MKELFHYFTEGPNSLAYISWFVKHFDCDQFAGIEKVLFLYLEYCSKLGIIAKQEYLKVFLRTELKKNVRKYDIRIDTIANLNYDEIVAFEQAVSVIATTAIDTYDTWVSVHGDIDEFKVVAAEFISKQLQERMTSVFTEQFTKMSQGEDTSSVAEETQIKISKLRSVFNLECIDELDFILGNNTRSTSGTDKARLISKTGIPAIDEDYGGVFSKALITFAGQPGSGKTRFLCACYVYPALTSYKVGVRFDELELAEYEVRNILVSIHIANLYKVKIPDRDINRDDLSEEQRRIVASARIDLFESGKYGRFVMGPDKLIVETMYEEATTYFKLNPDIQMWCIDYIGRTISKPPNRYEVKSLAERIDCALIAAKDVAKKADIASICVNQYNDEGNKAAFAGKMITVGMIQGGQSVQRHSDYDIAITYTADQKAANLRMLSTTKDRASVGFTFAPVSVDLAISRWTQINNIEERG